MAVALVAAGEEDRVRPGLKGQEDVEDVHPAGAGQHDNPDGGGILQPHGPGQVGPGIGAPAATETDNLRGILLSHSQLLHSRS